MVFSQKDKVTEEVFDKYSARIPQNSRNTVPNRYPWEVIVDNSNESKNKFYNVVQAIQKRQKSNTTKSLQANAIVDSQPIYYQGIH